MANANNSTSSTSQRFVAPAAPAGRKDGGNPSPRQLASKTGSPKQDVSQASTVPTAPRASGHGVKRDEIIFMANQLAVMVDTGVPLSEALDSIADQAVAPGMKDLMTEISANVKSGMPFSEALEQHADIFGNLFIALMRASEANGQMGAMLQRVAVYLQQERETRKKIQGAMTYPVCMLVFCAIVVVGLLVFILPRFEAIYAGKGAALPMPTQILMAMSNGLVHNWPLVLLMVGSVVGGAYYYVRTPAGRIAVDGLRIQVPLIGGMYRKAFLARSLRTMATMVSTGVAMIDGLQISARVAGNHYYAKIWNDLAERVKEGATLSDQLSQSTLVPASIAQMISAGERTGKLGLVMTRVAEYCEEDLNVAVKTITAMIEPVMIIIMGILVGGIAMALLLPVFSISKVMAQ